MNGWMNEWTNDPPSLTYIAVLHSQQPYFSYCSLNSLFNTWFSLREFLNPILETWVRRDLHGGFYFPGAAESRHDWQGAYLCRATGTPPNYPVTALHLKWVVYHKGSLTRRLEREREREANSIRNNRFAQEQKSIHSLSSLTGIQLIAAQDMTWQWWPASQLHFTFPPPNTDFFLDKNGFSIL